MECILCFPGLAQKVGKSWNADSVQEYFFGFEEKLLFLSGKVIFLYQAPVANRWTNVENCFIEERTKNGYFPDGFRFFSNRKNVLKDH